MVTHVYNPPKKTLQIRGSLVGRAVDALVRDVKCRIGKCKVAMASKMNKVHRATTCSSVAFAPLPILMGESLVGSDDPGKPIRRLPNRIRETVAQRCARIPPMDPISIIPS